MPDATTYTRQKDAHLIAMTYNNVRYLFIAFTRPLRSRTNQQAAMQESTVQQNIKNQLIYSQNYANLAIHVNSSSLTYVMHCCYQSIAAVLSMHLLVYVVQTLAIA